MSKTRQEKILEQDQTLSWNIFLGLIQTVERILKHERKLAKGKMQNTIPKIKSNKEFCHFPFVYLPYQGTAIFLGDIHGDSMSIYRVLAQEKFLQKVEKGEKVYLILLGDYADRGQEDIRTLSLVLSLKWYYRKNIFLLRGNHEEFNMGQYYGLLGSCIKEFGYDKGQLVFSRLVRLYERLPGIAITASGIVAVHGGVPVHNLHSLRDLNDEEELTEMRWNDPGEEIDSSVFNYKRGCYYLFGKNIFNRFMKTIGGKVLIRSHEYTAAGYKLMFDKRLLTIFSNGGKSPESGYKDFILEPRYVKVDLSKEINQWTLRHLRKIKY
ncbi:serine/threonine protein phosphatase [Patescibacteria group bacterium]|nr:serine/threonine protein phosphatase [Patescibacteria group bacterium]MBU0963733.1 serine/threonine protein phosphatase [Patescibacteria group bacterium]